MGSEMCIRDRRLSGDAHHLARLGHNSESLLKGLDHRFFLYVHSCLNSRVIPCVCGASKYRLHGHLVLYSFVLRGYVGACWGPYVSGEHNVGGSPAGDVPYRPLVEFGTGEDSAVDFSHTRPNIAGGPESRRSRRRWRGMRNRSSVELVLVVLDDSLCLVAIELLEVSRRVKLPNLIQYVS